MDLKNKEPVEREIPELLFTLPEVGRILKCNRSAVTDLVKKGHLRAMKLGHLKVSIWEIERFIQENTGVDLSDLDNLRPIQKLEVDVI